MKYMLIDITTVESTSLLAVAPSIQAATLMGRLYAIQGKTVIAPPVEGRGFSKLELLPLQYLFWNVCQEEPPADYQELIRLCLARIERFPVDTTPLEVLEKEVARLCPPIPENSPGKAPTKPNTGSDRPKAASTTGQVWELADAAFSRHYTETSTLANVDWKMLRGEIITACEKDGINTSTAATQYSKWAKAKKEGSK